MGLSTGYTVETVSVSRSVLGWYLDMDEHRLPLCPFQFVAHSDLIRHYITSTFDAAIANHHIKRK